ncbi:hypothetical protein B484DRAFT_326624 [Ochromonadaceae sp. CCMP2298]|nr:hypothetical protein B484DRAFT_326624 [Ochromonadaceae sp. CCMP2298]
MGATDVKIDYRPGTLSVAALRGGDYLQLLNIFPPDGLELTLAQVQLRGICGVQGVGDALLGLWVRDVYANQLHRVVSGTAPFRGLSNIGAEFQQLMAIPMKDYRKQGGAMRDLRRGTQALLRTVTRETLHVSQKLTMLLANALTELAADPQEPPSPHGPPGPHGSQPHAYTSISRELGSAAETVIAIPIREYVRSGPGGYLKCVIRAMPLAVLRPVAGVAEGLSVAMLGLRNEFDPAARLDEEDVWNVDIGALFPSSSSSSFAPRQSGGQRGQGGQRAQGGQGQGGQGQGGQGQGGQGQGGVSRATPRREVNTSGYAYSSNRHGSRGEGEKGAGRSSAGGGGGGSGGGDGGGSGNGSGGGGAGSSRTQGRDQPSGSRAPF